MNKENSDFSVVLPIHNEAELLKFSFPSIFRLNPKETILLFDNCTDDSYDVAIRIAKSMNFFKKSIFKIVDKEEVKQFSFRPTILRRMGYNIAKCDKILKTDADLILDPKIKDYIYLLGKKSVRIFTFEYIDYPISYRHMVKRFLEKLKLPLPKSERWLGGNILFFREDWKNAFNKRQENENKKVDLHRLKRGEDTLFHKLLLSKHYRSEIVLTNTIHLRPVESPERHYLRGQISWNVAKRPFIIILIQAIFFNRFNMIKGYLDAKRGIDRYNN